MGAATLALTGGRPPRTQVKSISQGSITYGLGTVTMSNSYATNGDTGDWGALSPLIGQQKATAQQPTMVFLQPSAGYIPEWVTSTKKIKVYRSAGSAAALAEVPNATDLSAVVFNALIFV